MFYSLFLFLNHSQSFFIKNRQWHPISKLVTLCKFNETISDIIWLSESWILICIFNLFKSLIYYIYIYIFFFLYKIISSFKLFIFNHNHVKPKITWICSKVRWPTFFHNKVIQLFLNLESNLKNKCFYLFYFAQCLRSFSVRTTDIC